MEQVAIITRVVQEMIAMNCSEMQMEHFILNLDTAVRTLTHIKEHSYPVDGEKALRVEARMKQLEEERVRKVREWNEKKEQEEAEKKERQNARRRELYKMKKERQEAAWRRGAEALRQKWEAEALQQRLAAEQK